MLHVRSGFDLRNAELAEVEDHTRRRAERFVNVVLKVWDVSSFGHNFDAKRLLLTNPENVRPALANQYSLSHGTCLQ